MPQLPQAFLQNIEKTLGHNTPAFVNALAIEPPVTLRLHPIKRPCIFSSTAKIPWSENGRLLTQRPSFTFDPHFHAGCYYVQEASSMYIEQVWKQCVPQNTALKVLDLCAAPGGKSTHLLSLMNGQGFLVTNEPVPQRNKILVENIVKWGYANVVVTQNEPSHFSTLGEYFDLVLVDAPCSGEGMFRKDPESINEWSLTNVTMCAARQTTILNDAANTLKPGGILIYSTCTYEPQENDEQIQHLLDSGNFEWIELNLMEGVERTKLGLQFYPHRIIGEGFFVGALRKKGSLSYREAEIANESEETHHASVRLNGKFDIMLRNEMAFALPTTWANEMKRIAQSLYIKNMGLMLGQIKGKDFLPSHDVALSVDTKLDFPSINLSLEEAIVYLRCEIPKVTASTLGMHLVKFEGSTLGWMKVIQGRMNNYYPRERRILKQNIQG